MKVAIVHDDLVQWGGAERVLLAMSETFPDAPIYTSVFDRSNPLLNNAFGNKKVVTSFIQKIPGWKSFYKAFLPLYPIAFEQFNFDQFDLVISHTTRLAKAIITKPHTKHVCYIHTPPRFLWNLSGEKTPKVLAPFLSYLRVYDQISASRVDYFLAGSKNAQKRIKKIYKRESSVVYPFVDLENFKCESFEGNYYLIISRLTSYKRVDIAVKTFNELGERLKIVGGGPKLKELVNISKGNIEFLKNVSESALVQLIAGCRALIVTGEEDFGLTPLEAQVLGKPVIAFGAGGVLETVLDKETGILFSSQDSQSLKEAISRFEKLNFDHEVLKKNAAKFSKEAFLKEFKFQLSKL